MPETLKRPGPESPPPTPRWVKIIVIIFIVFVLVVIILHLMGFGFGNHGASSFTSYAWLMERAADHL